MYRFDELKSVNDRKSLIGMKAEGLINLRGGGFNVPDGFVVTADEIDSFTAQQLSAYVDESAEYAVRSSGTNEDLEGLSFAGQYDTFLNVKGCKNILFCNDFQSICGQTQKTRYLTKLRQAFSDTVSAIGTAQGTIGECRFNGLFFDEPLDDFLCLGFLVSSIGRLARDNTDTVITHKYFLLAYAAGSVGYDVITKEPGTERPVK